MSGRAVSISVLSDDDMVTVCTWRVTGPEAAALDALCRERFGPPDSTLAPAEVLADFDADPRVVSTG